MSAKILETASRFAAASECLERNYREVGHGAARRAPCGPYAGGKGLPAGFLSANPGLIGRVAPEMAGAR